MSRPIDPMTRAAHGLVEATTLHRLVEPPTLYRLIDPTTRIKHRLIADNATTRTAHRRC
ncbi:MAG: hypothetical protein JO257_25190, partial [Deltaproteobacteria bacterium]|nr:hypothetical protein [Deltaproteobacteria bacterium]